MSCLSAAPFFRMGCSLLGHELRNQSLDLGLEVEWFDLARVEEWQGWLGLAERGEYLAAVFEIPVRVVGWAFAPALRWGIRRRC